MNTTAIIEERPPSRLAQLGKIPKKLQLRIAQVGYRHLTRGRLDKAKVIFTGLAELDPFDAYFQLALGSIAQRSGQLVEADVFYSRALKINPYAVSAWANRGEVRLMVNRVREGLDDLRRASSLDPLGRDACATRARSILQAVSESGEPLHD